MISVLESSISMVNKGTNPVGVVKGADRRFMLVKGELSFAGRLLPAKSVASNAGLRLATGGEEAILKSGDAIALLATEPSKLLEVHEAAPRGAKRKADDALGPPASGRCGGVPALSSTSCIYTMANAVGFPSLCSV